MVKKEVFVDYFLEYLERVTIMELLNNALLQCLNKLFMNGIAIRLQEKLEATVNGFNYFLKDPFSKRKGVFFYFV